MEYSDKQQMPKWILFIEIPVLILFLLFLERMETQKDQIIFLLAGVLPIILSFIFLLNLKLRVLIDKTGITIRMSALLLKPKHFEWGEIKNPIIRSYDAIGDYGGWGIRLKKGVKAYIMGGNTALEFETENGKKIAISIKNKSEAETVIMKYHNS